jgi:uncharacterized protein with ParB-like and HNH nuclease domain
MTLRQVTIAEIVRQAVNGDVNIPEFQRDFVWDPEKVKRLAESLYRNYPIGSFLMWNSSEYSEPRTAQVIPQPIWIVDGQQGSSHQGRYMGAHQKEDDTKLHNLQA